MAISTYSELQSAVADWLNRTDLTVVIPSFVTLAEAKAQSVMLRTFVDDCLALHLRGELSAERAAMAKLNASEMQNKLLDEFLQMHGGQGFMAEGIGSAWVDARVARIYGGSNEIMKEIVARGL